MSKSDHIKIIKPGILSTIQDAGRSGYRSVGIGPGGVMDNFAFHTANFLLGNKVNSPVLEMHFPAPIIEFHADCHACLTGADFSAKLNDKSIEPWKPFPVKTGDILSFEKIRSGFRCYLSVSGGFEAEEWLGSCSTNLSLKMGGMQGRSLQKDDLISIGKYEGDAGNEKWNTIEESEISHVYNSTQPVLCMKGPEFDMLDEQSNNNLFSAEFRISPKSNRMAFLLEGSVPLGTKLKKEMLSSATLMGTVQLLPNGNLAVLMADHQTTGGFPRILQILESQFPKLAQSKPGERMNFKLTDQNSAKENYLFFLKKCKRGGK